MSLPLNKLKIFGKQVFNHLTDEDPKDLNSLMKILAIIKSDELMSILTSRLTESDLYRVIFISFLMNKGLDISQIEKIVTNDLLLYKLTNYENPSTKRESCDDCDGDGNIECDYCSGDGDFMCYNCGGSGEVDCNECGGSGEDEEGNTCGSCGGTGNEPCDDCNGNGRITCDHCDGNGQDECQSCDGNGEVDSYEEYYDASTITLITMDDYVLSVKEGEILKNKVVDKLFESPVLHIRKPISYGFYPLTIGEIEGMYEGEPEDESDFYILTSPPIKL